MSVLVQFVVRQLDFLEGNHLLHQLLPGERRVRVDVQPVETNESSSDWLRGVRSLPNQRHAAKRQITSRLATNQSGEIAVKKVNKQINKQNLIKSSFCF